MSVTRRFIHRRATRVVRSMSAATGAGRTRLPAGCGRQGSRSRPNWSCARTRRSLARSSSREVTCDLPFRLPTELSEARSGRAGPLRDPPTRTCVDLTVTRSVGRTTVPTAATTTPAAPEAAARATPGGPVIRGSHPSRLQRSEDRRLHRGHPFCSGAQRLRAPEHRRCPPSVIPEWPRMREALSRLDDGVDTARAPAALSTARRALRFSV
jgi:hypothetical protein